MSPFRFSTHTKSAKYSEKISYQKSLARELSKILHSTKQKHPFVFQSGTLEFISCNKFNYNSEWPQKIHHVSRHILPMDAFSSDSCKNDFRYEPSRREKLNGKCTFSGPWLWFVPSRTISPRETFMAFNLVLMRTWQLKRGMNDKAYFYFSSLNEFRPDLPKRPVLRAIEVSELCTIRSASVFKIVQKYPAHQSIPVDRISQF